MANIYEPKSEETHVLLSKASDGAGATIVIPDLQRPYKWQPDQVILLVDSLIRGWPFGTLLLWKVDHKELQGIPHREFWQVVDRRENGEGATAIRKDPPATYHMVLDGQQRIQSLLLALGGDGWGFRLEDRAWQELKDGIRPRGRRPKHPHWSKGTLCFDVEAFNKAYGISNDVIGIDYRYVLHWVITDPINGQSKWPKPDNYSEPLPRVDRPENKGRYIRLGRLWSEVPTNPNLREKEFRNIAEGLLKQHAVESGLIENVLGPIGELMATLREVKLAKITFLELRAYDKSLWSEDEYNDAIVNIFTRLNSAGRTLTKEEITFAWLKVGWDDTATGGRTAGNCFEATLELVREKGLPLKMDDLVRAVSYLWAVAHHGGDLLSDKDLLRGDTVRPMAKDLANDWADIVGSIESLLDTARDRGLQYGQSGQYNSLNAVNILWCWLFLARRWGTGNKQKLLGADAYDKQASGLLEENIDRWMICSNWAGRWGASSGTLLATYAKEFHSDSQQLSQTSDAVATIAIVKSRIAQLVEGVIRDAVLYAQTLTVDQREHVSRYNSLLWVWHRLDTDRWHMSKIPLRTGRRQAGEPEVDHTVAYSLWETKVKAASLKDDDEIEWIQQINKLGNCTLLEKTFNISKSDRTLQAFMGEVHEIKMKKVMIADWSKALGLSSELLEPDRHSMGEIKAAIDKRDEDVRKEIVEFIQGSRQRRDL